MTAMQGRSVQTHATAFHSRRAVWLFALTTGMVFIAFMVYERRKAYETDDLRRHVFELEQRRPLQKVVVHELQASLTPPTVAAEPTSVNVPEPNSAQAEPVARGESTISDDTLRVMNEGRVASYESRHSSEPRDGAWSDSAERIFRERFSGDEFQHSRTTVDCRSTMCRIDYEYSDPDKGLDVLRGIQNFHPWEGPSFGYLNQEKQRGAYYVAREGFELPVTP